MLGTSCQSARWYRFNMGRCEVLPLGASLAASRGQCASGLTWARVRGAGTASVPALAISLSPFVVELPFQASLLPCPPVCPHGVLNLHAGAAASAGACAGKDLFCGFSPPGAVPGQEGQAAASHPGSCVARAGPALWSATPDQLGITQLATKQFHPGWWGGLKRGNCI